MGTPRHAVFLQENLTAPARDGGQAAARTERKFTRYAARCVAQTLLIPVVPLTFDTRGFSDRRRLKPPTGKLEKRDIFEMSVAVGLRMALVKLVSPLLNSRHKASLGIDRLLHFLQSTAMQLNPLNPLIITK